MPRRPYTLVGNSREVLVKSIIAALGIFSASLALAAIACARKGSQLVILQNDGSIYWPISDQTPAEGQNERLLAYAGKRVTATGKLYTRGGSNALVIEKIAESSGK